MAISESKQGGSDMKIEAIYMYPIKSMRAVSLPSALLTKYGLPYDRSFLLLRIGKDGKQEVLAVARHAVLSLFTTSLNIDDTASLEDLAKATLKVTFNPPGTSSSEDSLEIPLLPDASTLKEFPINLHNSPTVAREMPADVSAWFTARVGFEVVLLHLEPQRHRDVLGNLAPNAATRNPKLQAEQSPAQRGWMGNAFSQITSLLPGATTNNSPENDENYGITFADCAPYLVVSQTSVENVSRRLPEGIEMDRTKFRPNIVVSGAAEAWDEDYWAELQIGSSNEINGGARLACTANCVRCNSLNVDYPSGTFSKTILPLKTLQADRRVDPGARYSPCFGRYSFLLGASNQESVSVKVGDAVSVSKRNSEMTTFKWPGFHGWPVNDPYPV